MQSNRARTLADYRQAAQILWGEAGAWSVDEYQRLNDLCWGGSLPPVPVVIGLVAYGRCLGLVRPQGGWGGLPRISLASNHFQDGSAAVADTILHEMLHIHLLFNGLCGDHNGRPWCAEVERLSPLVLGMEVQARPVQPRRVNGRNVRLAVPGHLSRKALATWPHSLRGQRGLGRILRVESH
jgi:hypothetical protein